MKKYMQERLKEVGRIKLTAKAAEVELDVQHGKNGRFRGAC